MRKQHAHLVLIMPVLLAGCLGSFGPRAPSMTDAETFRTDRNPDKPKLRSADINTAVWRELDIGNDVVGPVTPSQYEAAGYNYVYRKCSKYFDLLVLAQNKTHFVGDVVSAGGTATSTILSALKASTEAIGSVAAGFGFAGAVVTAFDKRALMTPYPTETKTLILKELDAYRTANPPETEVTESGAIENVQHFAELCTYSGIARSAEQALATHTPDVEHQGNKSSSTDQITTDAGATTTMDYAQKAALYWYFKNGRAPACDDPTRCEAAADALKPVGIDLKDAGGFIDPKTLTSAPAEKDLETLYATNGAFKALADAFPDLPKLAAPARKAKAKPKAAIAAAAPTPAAAMVPMSSSSVRVGGTFGQLMTR